MQAPYQAPPGFNIETVLSPTEKPYYDQLFGFASTDGQYTAPQILQKIVASSQLDKKLLAEIWGKYCSLNAPGAGGLNRLMFYALMRGVALTQAGVPVGQHDQYLLTRNFAY